MVGELTTFQAILVLIYVVLGTSAVAYVKSEIFGVVLEFGSIGNIILRNIIWGIILGWLAIPVALIHYAIVNR